MLTVRATLVKDHLRFEPPFTPPAQPVKVLITFMLEAPDTLTSLAIAPTEKVSDRFRWRASRARTTDLGGKSASQLCIEDREDDWR